MFIFSNAVCSDHGWKQRLFCPGFRSENIHFVIELHCILFINHELATRKFYFANIDKVSAIKETTEFISRFKKLFQNKEDGTLKTWLADVSKSTSGIKKFDKGLESDFDAVNNALVTPLATVNWKGRFID